MLTLATVGGLLWSLREATPLMLQRQDRFKRDLRAVWVGMATFWLAWVSGPIGATVLFGCFSFLALREFITLVQTRRSEPPQPDRRLLHRAAGAVHPGGQPPL